MAGKVAIFIWLYTVLQKQVSVIFVVEAATEITETGLK